MHANLKARAERRNNCKIGYANLNLHNLFLRQSPFTKLLLCGECLYGARDCHQFRRAPRTMYSKVWSNIGKSSRRNTLPLILTAWEVNISSYAPSGPHDCGGSDIGSGNGLPSCRAFDR